MPYFKFGWYGENPWKPGHSMLYQSCYWNYLDPQQFYSIYAPWGEGKFWKCLAMQSVDVVSKPGGALTEMPKCVYTGMIIQLI